MYSTGNTQCTLIICLGDLSEEDARKEFAKYGEVQSVEIKERKGGYVLNAPPKFAFVNLKTDNSKLQSCFHKFSSAKWHGQYVQVEIAKESFLDRLQREREESKTQTSSQSQVFLSTETDRIKPRNTNSRKNFHSSSSDDEHTESRGTTNGYHSDRIMENGFFNKTPGKRKGDDFEQSENNTANNKRKNSNKKRLQSQQDMLNAYKQQKNVLKHALTNIDIEPKNRIVFNDEDTNNDSLENKKNKNSSKANVLFDESDDGEDVNFNVKKQFEGKGGQKLLELQSRFVNDKRFTLDARFADAEEEPEKNVEDPVLTEKEEQLNILESVLGKKVSIKHKGIENDQKINKTMLRFDPSQPAHSKFEIKKQSEKKDVKKSKTEEVVCQKEETKPVQVSKEKFYKLTDSLKQSLQEKQTFSLLNTFGRDEEKDETTTSAGISEPLKKTKRSLNSSNPFKYDTSDSEDDVKTNARADVKTQKTSFGLKQESFFFIKNDERLKEGLEFVKNLSSSTSITNFKQTRREIKQIVKAKVRNNLRNKNPFRKKLGEKRFVKVKKALKRR